MCWLQNMHVIFELSFSFTYIFNLTLSHKKITTFITLVTTNNTTLFHHHSSINNTDVLRHTGGHAFPREPLTVMYYCRLRPVGIVKYL